MGYPVLCIDEYSVLLDTSVWQHKLCVHKCPHATIIHLGFPGLQAKQVQSYSSPAEAEAVW